MSRHNDLSDTKKLPVPQPEQEPSSAPNAPVRRASMHNTDSEQPPRRPPEAPVRRAPQQQKKRKKRRKQPVDGKSRFGRICIVICTVAVLLFGFYSALSLLAIRQLGKAETGVRQITTAVAESDPKVRNILLIGTDSRGSEQGRADSIILVSISKQNHTVTLTSLLRDSYVSIPGHGTDKLNAAYAYGGATLLMDTVVNNFNIAVDDYVCIGFAGFVHLVDAFGGVEITLSDREAQAVNEILHNEVNGIMGDPADADYLSGGGTYLLNGKQALSYSRIRYVGNADFERTQRQRTVLTGLLHRAGHLGYSGISAILSNVLPDMTTNMSSGKLYLLSLTLPDKLLRYEMQSLRLPADGTYSDQYAPNGAMVLAVDFDANLTLYRHAVYDLPDTEETAS